MWNSEFGPDKKHRDEKSTQIRNKKRITNHSASVEEKYGAKLILGLPCSFGGRYKNGDKFIRFLH